jgi:alanine-synthesizing transaminase
MWRTSTSTESSFSAKKHGIFILSDLAYAEVYFDDKPPPSALQVPGAMEIAVEFTSMSKTYSMPGWRMGFAVGNERIIGALGRVKSYLDYGAFTPVQVAATAALNGSDDCIHEMRAIYKRRRDVLVELWPCRLGGAAAARPMFAWAPIPSRSLRWAASSSRRSWSKAEVAVSLAPASASAARVTCASRWSRTSSASGRPPQHPPLS